MKFCLADVRSASGLAGSVDCSNSNKHVRYRAYNGEHAFDIEVVSHLSETDSTSGKHTHTPDEIIKQRDFLIAKLRGASDRLFSHWQLRDYEQSLLPPAPRAQISTSYHCGHRSKSSSPDILKIGIWLYPKAF
jgi:hypothetical protein